LTMKYIVILILVVLIARIDLFIGVFERATEKVRKLTSPSSQPVEVENAPVIISMSEDQTFKQNPHRTMLMLLRDFKVNPDRAVREKIVDVLKTDRSVFKAKLDTDFESAIFGLRDLIYQREKELPLLLTDLMKHVEGENLEMIKRFFSLMMDFDLVSFLKAYSKTKDTNCMIAALHGDSLPKEEQLAEFSQRAEALNIYLSQEQQNSYKSLARNCQLVLSVHMNKLKPTAAEGTP
jgi:hypothetical protein